MYGGYIQLRNGEWKTLDQYIEMLEGIQELRDWNKIVVEKARNKRGRNNGNRSSTCKKRTPR
jgi:predicted house-cleaning noncanonical NTP pyrophosphatase (MazG superfamily)